MIVLSVSVCPQRLRGDLTKWMIEIDTGVYVGKLSARVRDALWKRICNNVDSGKVIMVYSAQNVQGYEVRTHNTTWSPIDYDGVILMKHPLPISKQTENHTVRKRIKSVASKTDGVSCEFNNHPWDKIINYVVIDLETTGLDFQNDDIIELAALKVQAGKIVDSFTRLISVERNLPEEIVELTGITQVMLSEGKSEDEVIRDFLWFIGDDILVSHNSRFDLTFINRLSEKYGYRKLSNQVYDTLKISRKIIHTIDNYRLATIARFFNIDTDGSHRAEVDAKITMTLFEKLKNMSNSEM